MAKTPVSTKTTTTAPEAEQPVIDQVAETTEVTEPVTVVEEAVTPAATETALQRLASIDGSSLLKLAMTEFGQYAVDMANNKPQSAESIARHQKRLFELYQLVFKLEAAEFQKAMRAIVALFRENETGAFTESRLFRGIQDLALTKNDLRLFNHLGLLLLKAGELGVATAGRESDLSGIAKSLPTDQARQYLTQFFR